MCFVKPGLKGTRGMAGGKGPRGSPGPKGDCGARGLQGSKGQKSGYILYNSYNMEGAHVRKFLLCFVTRCTVGCEKPQHDNR